MYDLEKSASALFSVYGTMVLMIIVALGLLGLILGSFVNAFVWRLHEQEGLQGKKSKAARQKLKDLSIMKGRSMCPDCEHTLAAKDLVPVFSWLSLGGKCRYCRKPISWQYPAVELATAVLFAVSYAFWPNDIRGVVTFQFVLWLVFLVAFMALAVYDLRWFLLPDKIVFPLIGLGLIQVVGVAIWLRDFSLLWQPLLSGVIFFGIFWVLFQVSKGKWIGGGDVKLAFLLGLLAGTPLKVFLALFASSLLGTLVSIPILAQGKKGLKVRIPYGPYLLAAVVLVALFGTAVVTWYERLLVV